MQSWQASNTNSKYVYFAGAANPGAKGVAEAGGSKTGEYCGRLKDGVMWGTGKLHYDDGSVYEGVWDQVWDARGSALYLCSFHERACEGVALCSAEPGDPRYQ